MNSIHRYFVVLPLGIALVIGIPAAGAHTDQVDNVAATPAKSFGQPGVANDATRTIAIHTTDAMRFNPGSLSIQQGETLRLRITNDGKLPHEFVLGTKEEIAEHAKMMRQTPDMADADANSVRMAPGKSADIIWNFSQAGTFLYACLIPGHWEAGMQGTVTVAAPAGR
jgi:uncharacterized cupredoxin-like copper-binding protein